MSKPGGRRRPGRGPGRREEQVDAVEDVVTLAGVEQVGAAAAAQLVVAGERRDDVVAEGEDDVVALGAGQLVRTVGSP